MKSCNRCGATKGQEEFRTRKNKAGNFYQMATCKECERSSGRSTYHVKHKHDQEYRSRNNARSAAWRGKNKKPTRKDLMLAAGERSCTSCGKTKALEDFRLRIRQGGEYYESTCRSCENEKKRGIVLTSEQMERRRIRAAAWLAENKNRRREYISSNAARFRQYRANRKHWRRAGKDGEAGSLDIKGLAAEQMFECAFCRKDISREMHIDHVIPLSRGGAHDIWNIQILCPTCNLRKGALGPIELIIHRGFSFQNRPL